MMEDRIADRWLRRRFSVLCWTVVIYELLLNILCAGAISADALRQILQAMQAGDFSGIIDEEQLLQNGWGYVATFAVGLVILYGWKGRDFFRSDRKKAGSMSAGAFFACVSIMLGIQYVFILWTELVDTVMGFFGGSVGEMMEAASLPANSFSIVLYSALLAPISEELLFRKLVQGNLMPFGKRFAILTSALLFGLFHGNFLKIPYAFAMGLILGYVAAEYSVWWSIALHAFNNFVLGDVMVWLSELLPELVLNGVGAAMLLYAFASVGILIHSREVIRTFRAEGMDRRCLKCLFTNSGMTALLILTFIFVIMTV